MGMGSILDGRSRWHIVIIDHRENPPATCPLPPDLQGVLRPCLNIRRSKSSGTGLTNGCRNAQVCPECSRTDLGYVLVRNPA